ncbi:unnamed protein product, partial [Urochloa humidicola]
TSDDEKPFYLFIATTHHGHPEPPLPPLQLHGHQGGPQAPEEAPAEHGEHQGEDGLRGLRAAREERGEVDARGDKRGGEPQAEQGLGDWVRGARQRAGTGKNAQMWPYTPYTLTSYPYVGGVYDKKAPAGFVRSAPQAMADPAGPEVRYMTMFSDDNANACAVM